MKKIVIMGSTGSIGTQTLDVVRDLKNVKVCGLSAGRNITLLEKQAREFLPELIVIEKEADAEVLRMRLSDTGIRVASGMSGLVELAQLEEAQLFVTAIVGMIGIRPTIAAIEAGKDIALANKETLVTAGHIIMPLAKSRGVKILPVDSEHSAIFQCLQGCVPQKADGEDTGGEGRLPIRRIWLTASGGAFRGRKTEELKAVKAADALVNPNWTMGSKVTVDSASLVNKGLEVIEAHWLFDVPVDAVQVVVQSQSLVHSMVEFEDSAVIAQIGTPDMHVPIQYALTWPKRLPVRTPPLDFLSLASITFEKPDMETFRGLPLAIQAGKTGGSLPTVFNAANEAAVAKFLKGETGFLDIYEMIEGAMAAHSVLPSPTLEEILETERWTHEWIESRWRI